MRKLLVASMLLLASVVQAAESLSVDPHFLVRPVANRSVMVCAMGLTEGAEYGISFPVGPFASDQDPASIFTGGPDGDHCLRYPSAGMELPPGSAWNVSLQMRRLKPERWLVVAESWVAIDVDPGSPFGKWLRRRPPLVVTGPDDGKH